MWFEHELRAQIDAETHARPALALSGPQRVRRLAFLCKERGAGLRRLQQQMSVLAGREPEGPDWARQLQFFSGGRQVVWELHNEFATLTWSGGLDDWDPSPDGIGIEVHDGFPVILAARIDVLPTPTITQQALSGFDASSLCYSRIFDGRAEAATDFRQDHQGFVRFELAVGDGGALRIGVIVRRLLEIETYRNMALLGLPLARQISPRVGRAEHQLTELVQRLGQDDGPAGHAATLAELHRLAATIGQTIEDTSFRFAATKAYGDVLEQRLARLGESAIEDFTSMDRFINNRAQPALATCLAMEKRLAALTEKVHRTTELLSARITLDIQSQNMSVLDAISSTGRSQYRLQLTVEGLSIIAISYYAIGIVSYVLEGVHDWLPVSKPMLVSLLAPLIVGTVFLAIRQIRKSAH